MDISITKSCVKNNQDNHFLQDVSVLLDKVLDNIEITYVKLKKRSSKEFPTQFSTLMSTIIDGLDIFLQSINHLINKYQLCDKSIFKILPIKQLQVHQLSVIKGILNAQKSCDDLMLADLLGYELKDNLTQWKVQIIPILKQEIQKNS